MLAARGAVAHREQLAAVALGRGHRRRRQGPGTLREAVLQADAHAGADTITFNIPGAGPVRTIRPLSALPEVTGPTTIDGATQPGVAV